MIVVLFGLPISANRRRGGLAIQFGINLLITFIYLVFMKVSQAFGKSGELNPLITAWLANFIFLTGCYLQYKTSSEIDAHPNPSQGKGKGFLITNLSLKIQTMSITFKNNEIVKIEIVGKKTLRTLRSLS